eukprot:TRINITY_DN9503_c0_g1_i1.p1 TRINITY_DN9503_c0_g1~~TRINITY_DN9503_c0_g1_i1.p1  ORF type:complete len:1886 (-),score=426.27 TRINITY_DN9503_c0_g1_i1:127-5784(-)
MLTLYVWASERSGEKVHPAGLPKKKPKVFEIIDRGDATTGVQPTVSVRGRHFQVCERSLFIFSLDGIRSQILAFVGWVWFDRIILILIAFNSVGLACIEYRAPEDQGFNGFYFQILDPLLTVFFTLECAMKVVAAGFFWDKNSYLRDVWNWLDFIVVLSALLSFIPGTASNGLGFLRVFRALRPLRSLNAVPQMKVLVNTVISSVPRLGNVTAVAGFLFLVFGIIGVSLMSGVFDHRCHTIPAPVLEFVNGTAGSQCWSWPYADDDRLCGGRYNCEASGGYCGSTEWDPVKSLRPAFPGGKQDYPWCEGSKPAKLFPETDFIHFDHIGGALLVVFQCTTMEGWTDIMYNVQDSYDGIVATAYFFFLIPLTSFFLLNVALAVVDEARADFDEEEEANHEDGDGPTAEDDLDKRMLMLDEMDGTEENPDLYEEPWIDCGLVHTCRLIAFDDKFMNVIMLFIVGNVITMMTERFPPEVAEQEVTDILELTFLIVFSVEMAILITALGPRKYAQNPVTAFDGAIVVTSVIQACVGAAGPLTALRTLRLFRVLNKLANRWPSFKVLLKAMVLTGISLNYWLVLFVLVLYIFTLMTQTFFAKEFHFHDTDTLDKVLNPGESWCPGTEHLEWNYRQDCIPRANFDTFIWAMVTIFQIMTGENWNTVMYAGMRAKGWPFFIIFAFLILFGQTLFLSLFLSMLMSKFDKVKDSLVQAEQDKQMELQKLKLRKSATSMDLQQIEDLAATSGTELSGERPGGSVGAALSSVWKEVKKFQRNMNERETWPKGYAWFLLSEQNIIRRCCRKILDGKLVVGGCTVRGFKIPEISLVFDSFILLCILISSVCMAIDTPLNNPKDPLVKIIRDADQVFAIIFIIEMAIKLLALGLIWSEEAYLRSAWNVLDCVVVIVSIINMGSSSSSGFLKTLRILRAFRPLRVISRNENLKLVVQTIFASMPHLLTLIIVAGLFLLIFSLCALSYLKGRFLMCDMETDVGLLKDIPDFRTPLCLPTAVTAAYVAGAAQHGSFVAGTSSWVGNDTACPSELPVAYQRMTIDTPICVGRCQPEGRYRYDAPPDWLCPTAMTKTEELPAMCPPGTNRTISEDELRGMDYVARMTRMLIMPCGGAMVVPQTGEMDPDFARASSCEAAFCPDVDPALATQCASNCKQDPIFCTVACGPGQEGSKECKVCRNECEAACRCRDFCEPLTKDAALCVEQGSRWTPSVSQNFDNIWNAMLTLFEISTTEGWVDVMYAAADSMDFFEQPKRDNQEMFWGIFFVCYLFFSNMFIINLSVGVIVDKFIEGKMSNQSDELSDPEKVWIKTWVASLTSLYSRNMIVNLENLHEKPPLRRAIYKIVNSTPFEHGIMGAIVINTMCMALKITPSPDPYWDSVLEAINYVFAGIFTIECVLKLFALRANYWRDRWNIFDFSCVVATLMGIIISVAFRVNISAITSVIRIFRIARLFRLLRFLKGLNKIFMALLLSLPKLMNVTLILFLLLILYSILGVSLFSTAKLVETLNVHGQFQSFPWAFITLFRASTGEAWNEIMHDLSKSEVDFYRMGTWCAPSDLYDTENKFDVLLDKCLIENPNSCVQTVFGVNILPIIYWVTYTLIISFMVMNLVIAVILEGYEDGKETPASEGIDICIKLWLKYDPDHRLSLPLGQALIFINEALKEVEFATNSQSKARGFSDELCDDSGSLSLASIPMKYVAALDVQVGENGRVHFISACKQVMRFVCLGDELASMEDLDTVQEKLDKKEGQRLQKLAEKAENRVKDAIAKEMGQSDSQSESSPRSGGDGASSSRNSGINRDEVKMRDLKEEVAALKLQSAIKLKMMAMGKRKNRAKDQDASSSGAGSSHSPAGPSTSRGDGGLGQDAQGPFCQDPLEEDPMPRSA